MTPKEVTDILNIDRDRIKYFKKKGVFVPEHPNEPGKSNNYTVADVETLKTIVVLTKAGLTCGDIRKIQTGELTLEVAFDERRRLIQEEQEKQNASLKLAQEIVDSGAGFNKDSLNGFWDIIQKRERDGEQFMDYLDEGYVRPFSFVQTVICPWCGEKQEVDLEDFLFDETVNESTRDNDMGADIVYTCDSEDNYYCDHCKRIVRIEAWFREYPIGAYDGHDVKVTIYNDEEI